MPESVAERFRISEIAELLARYPLLRLVPSGSMTLRVEGTLRFCANSKKTEVIEDGYDIRIEAPENFPDRMALAWETASSEKMTAEKAATVVATRSATTTLSIGSLPLC